MYCGACNIHVTYAINPIYENRAQSIGGECNFIVVKIVFYIFPEVT